MSSDFFKVTCSTKISNRNDSDRQFDHSIVQICLSMSTDIEQEKNLYRRIKDIDETHGKSAACRLAKTLDRTCLVSNRNQAFSNIHIQLFLLLMNLQILNKCEIALGDISNLLSISTESIRIYLNAFKALEFCFYDFHEKALYSDEKIFEHLSTTKDYLSFSVSKVFRKTVLRNGRTLLLPKSLLFYREKERNSLVTITAVKIHSHRVVQDRIRNNRMISESSSDSLVLRFRLDNLLKDGGINVENERLDNIRRWIVSLLRALDEFEVIADIKIKPPVGEAFLYRGFVDNHESISSLSRLGRKNELLNSTLEITIF